MVSGNEGSVETVSREALLKKELGQKLYQSSSELYSNAFTSTGIDRAGLPSGVRHNVKLSTTNAYPREIRVQIEELGDSRLSVGVVEMLPQGPTRFRLKADIDSVGNLYDPAHLFFHLNLADGWGAQASEGEDLATMNEALELLAQSEYSVSLSLITEHRITT